MNNKKIISSFKALNKVINESNKIVLTTHLIPDGDAIGSEFAMYGYLRQKGKKVSIINHSYTPDNYQWQDKKKIIKVFRENTDKYSKIINDADLIIIIDTNEYSRTKSMETVLINSPAKKAVIDHHLGTKLKLFDVVVNDTSYPATSELLYDYFVFDNKKYINKFVATNLYVGILTDTGSFRYPRTTQKTFLICADLIASGADPVYIYDKVYGQLNTGKIKLLGRFIDSLTYHLNGKLIIGVVTIQDFKDYHSDVQDVDGFSSFIMTVKNIRAGIVIVERPDSIKLSFRSKGNINMRNFAAEFGGGGHKNASGASLHHQDPFELKEQIINKFESFIKNNRINI